MRPQRSLAEIQVGMEEFRTRLLKGMHTPAEGLSMLCLLFYYDMIVLMNGKTVLNHGTVFNLLENYRTCAVVLDEYHSATIEQKQQFGRVMAFGLVQSISQIVETTRYIHRLVGLNSEETFREIKKSEYWRFRNWHTHAEPFKPKIPNDPSVMPGTKIFTTERTSADHVAYVTVLDGGWSGQVASFSKIFNDMRWDFGNLFKDILDRCKE